MKILLLSSVFILAMGINACSKKSPTSSSTTATASYNLKLSMVSSGASTASLFRAQSVSDSGFLNSSIGSSPAEEVTFKIQSMTLGSSTDSTVNVPIFSDTAGKAVTVRESSVDLSNFFTKFECIDSAGNAVTVPAGKTCECGLKADGTFIDKVSTTLPDGTTGLGCPVLAAGETAPLGVMSVNQAGTFNKLTVNFTSLGQMKGCVTGKYKANASDNTGTAATNCTKSGKGLDSGLTTTSSDFTSANPENMNVYLSKSGTASGTSFSKTFIIPGGITLGADAAPSITLLIDTGRMLRFYNGDTDFSSPGPDYATHASKAFFFTTVFEESIYIFLGIPGSIRGYRWAVNAENWTTSTDPGTHACTTGCKIVAGWMTLILDKEGAPLMASLMPDDDNALTVVKGGTYSTTNQGELDTAAIVQNSASNWDIHYNLGDELNGIIYGFNPTSANASSQDGSFSMTSNHSGTKHSWGELTFVRKL